MKCLEENRFDKYFLLFYNDGDMKQSPSAGQKEQLHMADGNEEQKSAGK